MMTIGVAWLGAMFQRSETVGVLRECDGDPNPSCFPGHGDEVADRREIRVLLYDRFLLHHIKSCSVGVE